MNPAPGKACLKVQEAREAAAFEAELGNLLDNHGQIRSTQVPALISHMGRTLSFQYRAVYLTILERTAKGSAAVMEEAVRHEHFLPIIKKWLEEFVEKKRWEELKRECVARIARRRSSARDDGARDVAHVALVPVPGSRRFFLALIREMFFLEPPGRFREALRVEGSPLRHRVSVRGPPCAPEGPLLLRVTGIRRILACSCPGVRAELPDLNGTAREQQSRRDGQAGPEGRGQGLPRGGRQAREQMEGYAERR